MSIFSPCNDEVEPVKMPPLKLMFSPFSRLFDKFGAFFSTSFFYIVILTALSFALGFSYLCMLKVEGLKCSESGAGYVIYSTLKFLLVIMFATKFYDNAYKGQGINLKNILYFGKREAKLVLLAVVFMGLNAFPMLSLYVLYVRVPNPDWFIETVFFGVVSIGFLVPFIAMRFYSIIGFVLDESAAPQLHLVWKKTIGNSLKIILSMFLILIVSSFILINFYANFSQAGEGNVVYIAVVSEVLYNLFVLVLLTIFINHCVIQKELLFNGE